MYALIVEKSHIQVLKGYVRQKAEPEGSMARGYIHYEALFFCSESICQFHHRAPSTWEEGQNMLDTGVQLLGASKYEKLQGARYTQIHEHVAQNDLRMEPWVVEYRACEAAWIEAKHPPNTFPSFLK